MRIRHVVFLLGFAVLAGCSVTAETDWPAATWPTAEPQAVGLDPRQLDALDADIAAGKYRYVDSLLVIRHGKVAYDRSYTHDYDRIYGAEAAKPSALVEHDPSGPYNYFNPWWHPFYRRGDLHTMQSVTKTVTSVVIGVATARQEFPALDTPVLSFFDAAAVANVDDRKRRLTIRHLLTMTAGFDWNEDLPYSDPNNTCMLMERSYDWVTFTIDRPIAHEPGTVFQYNSGATQLLSHIFRQATGHDIEEYAYEHLFRPLGIERYYWKRTPAGLIDTEGGLYLRPHDLARIAYLFLKNGVWEGKAVVSPEWVTASVAPSATVGDGSAGVKYGFKWWLYPYKKDGDRVAWAGSGFGGQRPIILPDYDLVAVFTGWTILPGGPSLSAQEALARLSAAIVK